MNPNSKILIGGGQEYHGPTAERDRRVVVATAKELFNKVGNSVTIVTGGMPGIPMDFVKAWQEAGGKHVEFIYSEEAHNKLTEDEKLSGVSYKVVAKTQKERRQILTQMEGLCCAFFVQGGQYTTDEIRKCIARKPVHVICFVGSGGASSGKIPYEGVAFDPRDTKLEEWMCIEDPNADVDFLASNFARAIRDCIPDPHDFYSCGLSSATSFFISNNTK